MFRSRWFGLVALLIAVLTSACRGEGGGEPATTTQVPPSTTAKPLIRTVMTEYAYDPDLWLVEEGAAVDVVIDNQGSIEHNWAVLSTRIASEEEFAESMVLYVLAADPGAVVRGELIALPAGDYQVICTIPGHFQQGQFGELRVAPSG